MFYRSCLRAFIFVIAVMTEPAQAQVYAVIALDASPSVSLRNVRSILCNDGCRRPLLEAERQAVANAIRALPDPLCEVESRISVVTWNDSTSLQLGWLPVTNIQARVVTSASVSDLILGTTGGTQQNNAFHASLQRLVSIMPAVGLVIMVTDDDAVRDRWNTMTGVNAAEAMGYQYIEIVVSATMTFEELTAAIYEPLLQAHQSPLLCIG